MATIATLADDRTDLQPGALQRVRISNNSNNQIRRHRIEVLWVSVFGFDCPIRVFSTELCGCCGLVGN